VHLRGGLLRAEGVRSVLAVGCGRGYGEVALALQFPEIHFRLTAIQGERIPNYQVAQNLAQTWALHNVAFGVRIF
jgi:hypothetical protein